MSRVKRVLVRKKRLSILFFCLSIVSLWILRSLLLLDHSPSLPSAAAEAEADLTNQQQQQPQLWKSRNRRPSSIKIFVVQTPNEITVDVENVPNPSCNLGPMNDLFNMEIHLHKLLLNSRFRTENPKQADFFYVPAYPNRYMCKKVIEHGYSSVRKEDYMEAISIALHSVENSTYWKRKNGSDFMFLVTHGFGISAFPEKINLGKSIRLMSYADRYTGYDSSRDIVISPSLDEFSRQFRGGVPGSPRNYLAAFKGVIHRDWYHSKGVRQLWWQLYKDSSDIIINNDRDSPFEAAIDSTFCLCPPGFYLWTPRPIQSLYFGCIPVIIGEETVLPFEQIFDWNEFSIRLPYSDAPNIQPLLYQVPKDRILAMQQQIKRIYSWFGFNHTHNYADPGTDAMDVVSLLVLTLEQLRKS